MPEEEHFRHTPWGRASNTILFIEITSFTVDSSRSSKYLVVTRIILRQERTNQAGSAPEVPLKVPPEVISYSLGHPFGMRFTQAARDFFNAR